MQEEPVSHSTRRAYDLAADRYCDLFHDELVRKPFDRAALDSIAVGLDERSLVLDAGCGPCAHVGRHLFDRGIRVTAVDVSDRCVQLARAHNPGMTFEVADLAALPFRDRVFDAILSYYSIIDTPSRLVDGLFQELHRVMKPGGTLLVVVKAGSSEGWTSELIGISTRIYFTLFNEDDIRGFFERNGFSVERLETRPPYEQEIELERIYALGRRTC